MSEIRSLCLWSFNLSMQPEQSWCWRSICWLTVSCKVVIFSVQSTQTVTFLAGLQSHSFYFLASESLRHEGTQWYLSRHIFPACPQSEFFAFALLKPLLMHCPSGLDYYYLFSRFSYLTRGSLLLGQVTIEAFYFVSSSCIRDSNRNQVIYWREFVIVSKFLKFMAETIILKTKISNV